jgi:hypothetical protein
MVISFALGAFAFGEQYKNSKAIGLRIARDLTFEFFGLESGVTKTPIAETVEQTKKPSPKRSRHRFHAPEMSQA